MTDERGEQTPQPSFSEALSAAAHFHSAGDGREDAVYDTAARFLAWIESDD